MISALSTVPYLENKRSNLRSVASEGRSRIYKTRLMGSSRGGHRNDCMPCAHLPASDLAGATWVRSTNFSSHWTPRPWDVQIEEVRGRLGDDDLGGHRTGADVYITGASPRHSWAFSAVPALWR